MIGVELIITMMLFAVAVLVFVIYDGGKRITFFKQIWNRPLLHYSNVDHKEHLDYIINILPELTAEEKEIILQRIFGRAIRTVRGRDLDGSCWFEAVTFFQTDSEEDRNYHLEQLKPKPDTVGIG